MLRFVEDEFNPTIEVGGARAGVFALVHQWMYVGEVEDFDQKAEDLFVFAHEKKVPALVVSCSLSSFFYSFFLAGGMRAESAGFADRRERRPPLDFGRPLRRSPAFALRSAVRECGGWSLQNGDEIDGDLDVVAGGRPSFPFAFGCDQ